MTQVNNHRELYRALSEFARRYQFRNRDEVCCYGLTVSQCYALQSLMDGPLTTGGLSERLGLDLSSTTRVVDQLVRKKLAVRARGIDDGRVRTVELTEAGRRLMTRVEQDLAEVVSSALDDLPDVVKKALPGVVLRLNKALQCCAVPSRDVIPAERIRKTRV